MIVREGCIHSQWANQVDSHNIKRMIMRLHLLFFQFFSYNIYSVWFFNFFFSSPFQFILIKLLEPRFHYYFVQFWLLLVFNFKSILILDRFKKFWLLFTLITIWVIVDQKLCYYPMWIHIIGWVLKKELLIEIPLKIMEWFVEQFTTLSNKTFKS